MDSTNFGDLVVTLEAAAAELGVSLSTARRLAEAGRLKTCRLLSRRVVIRADLDALLAEMGRAAR